MFYAWDIIITANTLENAPKTQTLKLSKGVITRADVKFPPGCHGLVKVRLMFHEFGLVPLSRDEWITGDGETVPSEAYYEMIGAPYQLKFMGVSEGCTYDHTITVRVQVLPKIIASMAPVVELLQKFLKGIGIDV